MSALTERSVLAAGEIDRANAAIKCVRPVCYAGVIEIAIENVFAMCSRRAAIVNNQRKNDFARAPFSVADVFTPQSPPDSIAAEAIARAAPVAAAMSRAARSLIGAMIGSRTTHPRRQDERLLRTGITKEAHGLFNRAQPFFHPLFCAPWKNDKPAIEPRTQCFNIRCIKSGILPGEVHLAKDGAGRNTFAVWHSGILAG